MLALEGITVLDLSRLAPGPFATMILADLGARVIRVEQPGGGPRAQQEREAYGMDERKERRDAALNVLLRNKECICLNLKSDAARQVLYALVRQADVVVEGFRPGVVKRLGVDYDSLKAINPRIVYCSISGYGQDGPYRELVGHDINYISHAGILHHIGESPDRQPVIPLNLLGDYAGGGMLAALSILAALRYRDTAGEGQYVDISMTDGAMYLAARVFSEHWASGDPYDRGRSRLSGGTPQYNVYQCKDGQWISVGCNEPWFWENLCKALGTDHLIPHMYDKGRHQAMIAELRQVFATRTRDEWIEEFKKSDIAYAPVWSMDEAFNDPQIRHRGMALELQNLDGETVKQVGVGPKLSATPAQVRRVGVPLGYDTDRILRGLGYSEGEIKEMREQGAVA